MYTVTAIYQDSEIGYGEGEGYDYAMRDCIDSIDSQYVEHCGAEIILRARSTNPRSAIYSVETPLTVWLSAAKLDDYCN